MLPESEEFRRGRIAVSRVFQDESKLKSFMKQTQDLRIDLETCDFRQVESYIRELSPDRGAVARGGHVVISYLPHNDNERELLQQHFRHEVKQAKAKHPDLFR